MVFVLENKIEQFEWWITCIPDKVEWLKEILTKEIASQLDYSSQSLNVLSKFLLSNYSLNNLSLKVDKELWDCLASYVGTTFRKNLKNSFWDIELNDKSDVYYNKPILRVKDNKMPPFCPHLMVLAVLDRGDESFLSTILNNYVKYSDA